MREGYGFGFGRVLGLGVKALLFSFAEAVFFFPLLCEDVVKAHLVFGFEGLGDFGDGGEGPVEFVFDGFFDGQVGLGWGFAAWLPVLGREVDAGYLESVEEESGASGV